MNVLIFDATFLCHLASHSKAGFGAKPESIHPEFLRRVAECVGLFEPGMTAFAFDSRRSLRREEYPFYKASREPKPDAFHAQVKELRKVILPGMGFSNVFLVNGLEADDVIASIVYRSLGKGGEAVIVTRDKDMWQLINEKVKVHDPVSKETMTRSSFINRFGQPPPSWLTVKSIMGDASDEVPGVEGVGEKGAWAWVKGELDRDSPKYKSIRDANAIRVRNVRLMQIPWEGCPTFPLRGDAVTAKTWDRAVKACGAANLKGAWR